MMFLVLLAIIGLVLIVAGLFAIRGDGYGSIRTRDADFYREDFHRSGFTNE